MAISRTPIQREPAEGLLGRVAVKPTVKTVKPAPRASKPSAPAVAAQAPAASSLPSWSDYLAQQQAAFQPQQRADWSPLNNQTERYSSFDPASAKQQYEKLGGKLTPTESWSYLTSGLSTADLGKSDIMGAVARQRYEQGINQALSQANPDAFKDGYRINSFQGYGNAWKDLGKNYYSVRPLNADGTLGAEKVIYHNSGSFLGGLVKSIAQPALAVASIIPSPIQPFAQVANAALAIKNGKPLNAALSLVGAANSAGLLGNVGNAASAGEGSNLYSLGNAKLGEVTAPGYLGSANLGNATGLGGTGAGLSATTDIFSGIGGSMATGTGSALSPTVQLGTPNYSLTTADPITTPNGEGLSTGPVNGGTGSGLSATPGSGLTLADPGAANGLLGGAPSAPSIEGMIEQAKAAGKSVADWAKANPLYARAAMMAGGALLNTVGGNSSSSGGSSYKDDGYRPTISRGGFQASIPAPGRAPGGSGMAPGGPMSGITLPSTGQANDGLWRYAGNRPGGFLPSPAAMPTGLISPPPRMAPQTGLISPPAVSYNPRPTGPLPTNLPPMQYGYDDPVPPNQASLTPEQQRLMSPLLGLLNTNPAPRGWM